MTYRPDLNDELRDRHGRSGKIVDIEFENPGLVYVVEWNKVWGKIIQRHSEGEVAKARRRFLKVKGR